MVPHARAWRIALASALLASACASRGGEAPAGGSPASPLPESPTPPAATEPDASADAARAGEPSDAGATTQAATVIVEPSDDASALVAAIRGATSSVHMTMYLMTSPAVIDALGAAAKRTGVDVRVVLNASFPGGAAQNQSAYDKLQAAGVHVVWAPSSFTFTHEKCVVIDGAEAWIMTMNATTTAPTKNREYLVRDRDPSDVAEADAIFQADYAGTAITPTGKLVVAPVNARDALLRLIASATRSLAVEGEELSDGAITTALANAARSNVAVRVVLSDAPDAPAGQSQAVATLKQAGARVVVTTTPYIHAKAIVADDARAYVGSENFTTGSLLYNRELGVLLDAAAEVAKVASAIAQDFAAGAP